MHLDCQVLRLRCRKQFHLLPNFVPNVTAGVLPERDGMLNFVCFVWTNAPCDPELESNTTDPSVVTAYMKQHFGASLDIDLDEFGREWVSQQWFTNGQVSCNKYHSNKFNAVLLGDAAHATAPNLAQGMNTALEDVKVLLDDLLETYEGTDDETTPLQLDTLLPAYSKERVKEGNALTELSSHAFCVDVVVMMEILFRQCTRRIWHQLFPWCVPQEPLEGLRLGMPLSQAYDELCHSFLAYLPRSRRINEQMKRDWFEYECGMRQRPSSSCCSCLQWILQMGLRIGSVGIVILAMTIVLQST